VSRSKQKGTAWETAIVRYLNDHGFPNAERRALSGTQDRGDIAGITAHHDALRAAYGLGDVLGRSGVCVEAKNCSATSLGAWMDEAIAEQANGGADYAVVWHHRRGKASPGDGFVTMTGAAWVRLIRQAGYGDPEVPA